MALGKVIVVAGEPYYNLYQLAMFIFASVFYVEVMTHIWVKLI